MTVAVIIPFRGRDFGDPLRQENLTRVVEHWQDYPGADEVIVSSDGRDGNAPFNRSAAYNRAAANTAADMLIFAEADLLIGYHQVDRAIRTADSGPGMVVPFSWFMALGEADSARVRAGKADPEDCDAAPVRGHRGSIGAINVVSRHTLDLVGGYDEQFEGAWYDDDAMKIAFDMTAGPTRFVEGSGYHLWHLSGGRGGHLSRADRAATSRNRLRLQHYRQAHTAGFIRMLTQGLEI